MNRHLAVPILIRTCHEIMRHGREVGVGVEPDMHPAWQRHPVSIPRPISSALSSRDKEVAAAASLVQQTNINIFFVFEMATSTFEVLNNTTIVVRTV